MSHAVRFAALALLLPPAAFADVLPVPSPEFATIQRAIDLAKDGDTVLVAPGEYRITEPIRFNPKLPPEQPPKNLIVRSEGGPEVTTIRLEAEPPVDFDPFAVAQFFAGESDASVLEGFTITHAEGLSVAGIRVAGASSPRIENCVITGNGGIGAICSGDSTPSFSGCRFVRNRHLGVVVEEKSAAKFIDCSIRSNSGFGGGGGLLCQGASAPEFTRSSIVANFVVGDGRSRGAGIECRETSAPSFSACEIVGNVGYGVYAVDESRPSFVNCLIYANRGRTFFQGGVVCFDAARPALLHSVVASNASEIGIGGTGGAAPILRGCVVWGHPQSIESSLELSAEVSDSVIEGPTVFPGPGNLNEDPLFVSIGSFDFDIFDETNELAFILEPPDYRLQDGSPCIDAAPLEGAPRTDYLGIERPCGLLPDIGAYEFCSGAAFLRGNADGATPALDLSDGIFVLNWLFLGGREPPCLDAADSNDDGRIEIADAVRVFTFLFLGGVAPEAPGPTACGQDPTRDELGCVEFPACTVRRSRG
jgi:parallel beta-helix repeat protein